MKRFNESLGIATLLTAISYIVGMYVGWITELNWLEIFAVFTSYSCTYMCVKQTRWNYPIGAISTAALCVLFYQQDLLASAAQNALLTPWLLYGWFRWRPDPITRPVTSVFSDNAYWLAFYVGFTIITYFIVSKTISMLGGNMALIDTGIFVGSILAQIMLDNKKLENWYIWAIVDVVAIGLYFQQGLYLVAFQFVFFLANTVWGWYEWKKTMKKDVVKCMA